MISEIKNLELIGQNASLKQHGSVSEMLSALGIDDISMSNLNQKEFVCIMLPDDDGDSDDTDDNTDDDAE